jgi:tripartite-type tricarboxylate transporter receptor subunit TctC
MNASLRNTLRAALAAAVLLVPTSPLWAQGPQSDKPIRLVLPVGAGSGVDTIMRAASGALSRTLGQSVVVENLPGAGGIIGTQAVVRARPDGLTLGVVSNNHVTNPSVYKKLPFDPVADITPISVIGSTPFVLVVNPAKLPASNVAELVALLKAKPDTYNYGSSGNGTIIHLAGAMFLEEAGVTARHIPYKGLGPMITDLIGGQVEMGVVPLNAAQGHLKSGALRAIGVGSKTRAGAAPDIPTIAEQGVPDYDVAGWFAVVGPAKLPAAEVQRIHDGFAAAFATPEVKEAMAKQGNDIDPSTPEAAAKFFQSEMDRYAKLVKKANIQID